MGWRLFRRTRIAPGVRVNLSRSGLSVSLGPRGFTKTFGPRGNRTTVSIPGTGISYTDIESGSAADARRCLQCGERLSARARFCSSCGAQA